MKSEIFPPLHFDTASRAVLKGNFTFKLILSNILLFETLSNTTTAKSLFKTLLKMIIIDFSS